MGQLTNIQAIRIYNSIESNISKAAAEDFAKNLPLSKSATFERKFKWAEEVCRHLKNKYSQDDIKKIRMGCACGPSEKQVEDTRALYLSSKNFTEFAERYSCDNHSLWCEGDTLFFFYPCCYCSCVKRMNKPLTDTWCMCTLGYTKRLFDYILNCETSVELLESIKTGSNRCLMKITKA